MGPRNIQNVNEHEYLVYFQHATFEEQMSEFILKFHSTIVSNRKKF